jgi:dsRNA-specific ribonuclease
VRPRPLTGVKRRVRGSAAEACAKAWAEAGGVKVVEAESGLKARRLYAAADPDANHGDKPLSWEEVVRLTRDLQLTAFADALAALTGAVVLDGADTRAADVLAPLFARHAGEVTVALLEGRTESAGVALDATLRLGAALRAALNARPSKERLP